jgi:hypothetical protein
MTRLSLLALLVIPALAIEPAGMTLDKIKRVYVESLGASPPSNLLRDMIVASLAGCASFIVTEDKDHADAILRGTAMDDIFSEQHHSSDNINVGTHTGSSTNYSDRYDRTGSEKQSGLNIGQTESSQSNERKHEASASVRLVNRAGDVIWSTTQESGGAKFKSASADVAEKIFRKLTDDLQRARASASAATQAGIPDR